MYLNKVLLKGRMGGAPVFETSGAHRICRFSLASRRGEHVEWHHVVAYGEELGEVCQAFRKGDWIFLECFFHTRESVSGGKVRKITDLVIETAHLVEQRGRVEHEDYEPEKSREVDNTFEFL